MDARALTPYTPRPAGHTARVAFATLATLAFAGLSLIPAAIAAPIGIAAILGLVTSQAGAARTNLALRGHAERRQRGARRAEREAALRAAGCSRGTLHELDWLVEGIERRDPELAYRLELESLLDRHVTLAIAHERALAALAMANRMQLQRIRDEQRDDPAHDPRRLELAERRLACHEQTEAQAHALAEELEILADTIRLIAQRVARPDEVASDDTIERCLGELDARDAASRTLATDLH